MVLIGSLVVAEVTELLLVVVAEVVLRHLHMLVLGLVILDHLEIRVVLVQPILDLVVVADVWLMVLKVDQESSLSLTQPDN